MNLFAFLLSFKKKTQRKTLAEYQREILVRAGRQQFKKLQDLGLNIPVRLA
jgi:hypothetical protein